MVRGMGNIRRSLQLHISIILPAVLFFSLIAPRVYWIEKKIPETHQKTGTVVVVYDGDTIKVRFSNGDERRVRLIGVDCPEIDAPDKEESLRAKLARRFSFYHLFRKAVELTYESEREDKYGRLLAYVWIEGKLFNAFILSEGFAGVFLAFPYRLKKHFIQVEKLAREQGRGFWREKPYPLTEMQDIKEHIGKLVCIRFTCIRIRHSGRFHFLYSEKKDFAVLIPDEYRSGFPDLKTYERKNIEAFGFLEVFKGQPQIMVFAPSQLKLVS
jgi:micrococcal nuclease